MYGNVKTKIKQNRVRRLCLLVFDFVKKGLVP